jgi:hypothetical protein
VKMKTTSPTAAKQRGGRVIARAAADEDEAADEEGVSMSDLVEMEVGGVSVSDQGFVALLVPKGCKNHLPRAKNPVEVLRNADVSAEIPEDIAARLTLPILLTQVGLLHHSRV